VFSLATTTDDSSLRVNNSDQDPGLEQKIAYELQRFMTVFLYLALLIGAFNTYRWLLMAEYHVGYFVYGYGLLEALALAKIVVVGESLHLGERFSHRPLIVPSLYKAMLFGIIVLAFSLIEHLITGFLHGQNLAEIFSELHSRKGYEILARILVMFVAFIPFFAFREAGRALGRVKLFELFFRSRAAAPQDD
jgi:hypothetical protein